MNGSAGHDVLSGHQGNDFLLAMAATT
ncbi:hypothetical protein LOF28_18000 [Sinorhizobium meliloti]|nr:hypothetical protein [Sinorhizobium meliloti]